MLTDSNLSQQVDTSLGRVKLSAASLECFRVRIRVLANFGAIGSQGAQ